MGKTPKNGFNKRPQDINRKGRPKGKASMPDLLRRLLAEETPETLRVKVRGLYPKAGDTMLETIMRQVLTKAVQGERWAVEFLADRTEGKAVETVRQMLEDFRDDTEDGA